MSAFSLHIGLNKVDPAAYGGWDGALKGCVNDALSMQYIAHQLGYDVTRLLLDEEATLQTVLRAFAWLASNAHRGDTVLISYSGHGGQVPDRSGDEQDGLDETWVLYDGMLPDDAINALISRFTKGVRVIVVSDSCHSGTVTKSAFLEDFSQFSRGLGQIKAAPAEACRAALTSVPTARIKSLARPRIKAAVVQLSGCADSQLSWDGEKNGLFTQQLLYTYAAGKFQGSYAAFRKAIARAMPLEQTPQILTMGANNPTFLKGPVFSK